jgi:hypothetical protein
LAAGAPDLRMRARVVETLGPELTVHGQLIEPAGFEGSFVAVLPAEHPVARGDELGLVVERLHLFDASTERTLRC